LNPAPATATPVFTIPSTPTVTTTLTAPCGVACTVTPTRTPTPADSATPTETLPPTTPTFTTTPTAPCGVTCSVTPTPTFSSTSSPTQTPSNCHIPRLTDDVVVLAPASGNAVTLLGYARDPGITVVVAYYDGIGSLVSQTSVVSNASGYLTEAYTFQGTESFAGDWHIQVFPVGTTPEATYNPSAAFHDMMIVRFVSPTPTATATAPCMNMVTSAADPGYLVRENVFVRDACHTHYVRLYATTGENTLAWYDASNQLVHSQTQASSFTQHFSYAFNGSGAKGTWHITLFASPATPAPTWPGHSGGLSCGPSALAVQ